MDLMIEHDYQFAWAVYLFGALGCLLVWMRITRWIWRWLREPLTVLITVLLFTPTLMDPVKDYYAPAVAMSAMDLLFKVGNNILRAASDLAMYSMIALGVYVVFALVRWPIERWWRKRQPAAPAVAEDPRTLRERMEEPYEATPRPVAPPRSRVEPKL